MKNRFKTGERGFIKWIIIIIIGLILASYFFDFSVQDAIEDERTQSNWEYIQTHLIEFYEAYLEEPITWVIDFLREYLWEPIMNNIDRVSSEENILELEVSETR